MADRKITDLTALAAGSQATGDLLTIVDVSEGAAADKNKKITVDSLFKGIPGDVGIGVSSPGASLDVQAASDQTVLRLRNNGGNNTRLLFANKTAGLGEIFYQGDFRFVDDENADAERLRIDSSGRVGIGTSSPDQMLHLSNNSGPVLRFENTDTTITSGNSFGAIEFESRDASSASGVVAKIEGFAPNTMDGTATNGGAIRFSTATVNPVSLAERMRIDSSGDIDLFIAAANNATRTVSLRSDYGGGTFFDNAALALVQDNSGSSGGHLQFLTTGSGGSSPSERMRIDSSGKVGIGTSSPTQKLSINGNLQFEANDGVTIGAKESLILNLNSSGGQSSRVLQISDNGTARVTFQQAGNVGIGTNSPSSLLHISGNDTALRIQRTSSLGFLYNVGTSSTSATRLQAESGPLDLFTNASQPIIFKINGDNEKARIHTNGNFGIGTSSPARDFHNSNGVCLTTGAAPQYRLNGGAGDSNDNDRAIFGLATANNHFVSGAVAGDTILRTTSGGNLMFGTGTEERMRIAGSGYVEIGNSQTSNSYLLVNTVSNQNAVFNRTGTDGTVVIFRHAGVAEGTISISGNTVSYNGGHLSRWSQLAGGAERTEILRGSVLSNLDEMCEWGEEANEQLNRMKVSDVEGDVNVSGVFQGWDDDDDTYTDDFYCAMTGDFVIRIAQGTTVARGDLLMSAGDGTAKPQDDDIVRSKTIAKVTSTTVSTTYADGSYCVPCVLMAC